MLVCGTIQSRSWTDQANQKHYTTEVVADEIGFVDSKPNNSAAAPAAIAPAQFVDVSDEDNLPF